MNAGCAEKARFARGSRHPQREGRSRSIQRLGGPPSAAERHNCAGSVVSSIAGPGLGQRVATSAHQQLVDNFRLANCGQTNRQNPCDAILERRLESRSGSAQQSRPSWRRSGSKASARRASIPLTPCEQCGYRVEIVGSR